MPAALPRQRKDRASLLRPFWRSWLCFQSASHTRNAAETGGRTDQRPVTLGPSVGEGMGLHLHQAGAKKVVALHFSSGAW